MNRKRWGRVALGLILGLALVAGSKFFQAAGEEVPVRYDGPPGALSVELKDAEGVTVRRAYFGPSVERAHTVRLVDGRYQARLAREGALAVERSFTVEGARPVVLVAE